jgi:hypothetical protein
MARFVVGAYYVIPWGYPSELIGYFLSPTQVYDDNGIHNFLARCDRGRDSPPPGTTTGDRLNYPLVRNRPCTLAGEDYCRNWLNVMKVTRCCACVRAIGEYT